MKSKGIEWFVAFCFVGGILSLVVTWLPAPPPRRTPTPAPPATASVPEPLPEAQPPAALEPGRHWRIAFEVPGGDVSGAAYALETRAGDRYAIALRCDSTAAPNKPTPADETCAADVPHALRGKSVQLVQLWLGEVYWRSPQRLTIPSGEPRQ